MLTEKPEFDSSLRARMREMLTEWLTRDRLVEWEHRIADAFHQGPGGYGYAAGDIADELADHLLPALVEELAEAWDCAAAAYREAGSVPSGNAYIDAGHAQDAVIMLRQRADRLAEDREALAARLAEVERERNEALMLAEHPDISTLKDLAYEVVYRGFRLVEVEREKAQAEARVRDQFGRELWRIVDAFNDDDSKGSAGQLVEMLEHLIVEPDGEALAADAPPAAPERS